MGNCLAQQGKVKCETSSKAYQLLSELTGHIDYLLPGSSTSAEDGGQMPTTTSNSTTEPQSSVVRLKLVITKHELEEMLRNGAVSTAENHYMVSQLHDRRSRDDDVGHYDYNGDDESGSSRGWKPALESIPEGK